MLLKLAGIVCILGAGLGIGYRYTQRLLRRTRQIEGAVQAVTALDAQIRYLEVPLYSALRDCVRGVSDSMVARLLITMADRLAEDPRCEPCEAFRQVKWAYEAEMALAASDWELLFFLCANLGQTDRTAQEKQLALCLRQLSAAAEEARLRAEKNRKLPLYLGMCGACMVNLYWI